MGTIAGKDDAHCQNLNGGGDASLHGDQRSFSSFNDNYTVLKSHWYVFKCQLCKKMAKNPARAMNLVQNLGQGIPQWIGTRLYMVSQDKNI